MKKEKLQEAGRAGAELVKRGVMLASMVLVGALVLSLFYDSSRKPSGVYSPKGYYERVKGMLAGGALRYTPPRELPAGERADGNMWGKITLDEGKAESKHKTFYEESRRLRLDLEQFNQDGPGGLFLLADGKPVVSRWAHNFELPYPQKAPFPGAFSFRGEEMPTLASEKVLLTFIETEESPDQIPARELEIVEGSRWLTGRSKNAYRAKGYDLLTPSGQGRVLGLKVSGEHVRLETPENRSAIDVHLNGIPLNRENLSAEESAGLDEIRKRAKNMPPNWYQLEVGDRLLVRIRGDETVFRFGRLAGGLVNRSWMENGKEINKVDPELAREIPYLEQLHDAAHRFVARHPDPESLKSPNIRLTLDRGLHRSLRTELFNFVEVFDAKYSAEKEIERQPAAISVIDALTGDVLAMPSYPSPDRLDELLQLQNSGRLARFSDAEKRRLGRNQNLLRVPIGSTTKPLLATAIWNEYPELRRLVVDEPAESIRVVSGYDLKIPMATITNARTVGPEQFLEKSSNAYTASLYLATLADRKSYRIDRKGYLRGNDGGVDYSEFIRKGLIVGGLGNRPHPGNAKLSELFNVDLNTDWTAEHTRGLDPSLLEPMLRELGVKDGEVPRSFQDVVSLRTNLGLQSVDTVRGELIAILLGGHTNRWSNVKLAESYARLGTGRRVRMRLTIDDDDERPEFENLKVDREVLGLVHKGMTAAVGPGGTARYLETEYKKQQRKFAAKGLEFRMIGKTGTARRIKGRECAAFAFYAEVLPKGKSKPLAAVATTIYLQDRADVRDGGLGKNSGVAVRLAERVLPHLAGWLEDRPEVRGE